MTDDRDPKPEKMSKKEETDFLELATKRLRREVKADQENRKNAVDDLKFLNGDEWDPNEERKRGIRGRPVVKSRVLRKYVNQVVGDMRQNRARVKVRPVDSAGDVEIAKVRSGIISNVEYLSNADAMYDYAGEMLASCGYGAWRVLERWCEDNPFVQEIYLERIKNPFLVYMDSGAKSEVYADAKYGFVLEKLSKEEFEERYPDEEVPTNPITTAGEVGTGQEVWWKDDAFFIADYYVVETEKKIICLMKDGRVLDEDEHKKKLADWKEAQQAEIAGQQAQLALMPAPPQGGPAQQPQGAPQDATAPGQSGIQNPAPPAASPVSPAPGPLPEPEPPEGLRVVRRRKTETSKVKWYAICQDHIIDGPKDISGKFIPVILAQGPEMNIEGKKIIRSMVRDAKDAIRLLDFWITFASEALAIQPKAPWKATPKMMEGFETIYAQANNENIAVMPYNIDEKSPSASPAREQPPSLSQSMFEIIAFAQDLVKQAIGMFGADVGDKGPELSGKAIMQRQKPGDIGTFQFIDNLSRAIAHSGRIINEKIPYVYDTERDVRIRNIDDTETFAPVNMTVQDALKTALKDPQRYGQAIIPKLQRFAARKGRGAMYNDLTAGKYDVVVTTGPSYATQRQESAVALQALVQAYPKIMDIAGDLVYKFQDFLGAEDIAERIAKTMPPWLVPPKEGEQRPMRPPTPEQQALLGDVQVKAARVEVEKEKVKVAREKVIVEKIKALTALQGDKHEMKKQFLELLEMVFAEEQPQGPGKVIDITRGQ